MDEQLPTPQRPPNNSKWAMTKEERTAAADAVNKHVRLRDQHDKELAEEMKQAQAQKPQLPPSASQAVSRMK